MGLPPLLWSFSVFHGFVSAVAIVAVPRARSRGYRTLGALSLGCDTVSGCLVAGGPGCPQEVLASLLGQAGWEGPQNQVKE